MKTQVSQINIHKTVFDVCVVGSGAAGGVLSSRLAAGGLNVIVVEGGPKVDTRSAFTTHSMPYHFKNRKMPVMMPGVAGFEDERTRGVGGKTLLWNAVSLRLSHRDFKGHTLEGAGEDWPLDYPELAPYYDQIEREIGVCGNADHLEDLPDGIFLPPLPMRCSERIIQRGAARLGIKVIHVRKATLTRNLAGRPACHYCGNCMAGCDVVAKYNSADVHLVPAALNHKLTIMHNSVVTEVVTAAENRVNGVRYLSRESLRDGRIQARAVVVSCACIQSVALLLMSRSRYYPDGLANSSGELGKNYIPHFTGNIDGFATELIGSDSVNEEGALDHAYIPSYAHAQKREHARSFGIQFNYHNRRLVPWARSVEGFGAELKSKIRKRYPAFVNFAPYGEMLPSSGSRIELDPDKKDRFGLPKARVHIRYGDNERKLFETMRAETRRILEASGVQIISDSPHPATNHELGGCRMGNDPRRSVVNAFCQAHGIPNLFVVDGSVFPSASEKNPTLTIMALAARTADYILERFKKSEL